MSNNKNITINIGPQDSESWLFIAIAAGAIAFFVFALPAAAKRDSEIEKAKIEAKAK